MIDRKSFLILCFVQLFPPSLPVCIPSATQCGCSRVKPLSSASKIVGGFTARPNSWPWMVSLRRGKDDGVVTNAGSAFCGGTLISDKFIVTAAHCVDTIKASQVSDYFAVVGAQYRNDTNPVRFKFKAVLVHPKYDGDSFENDIALIELLYRVDFNDSKAGFVCPPPSNRPTYPYAGMNATATGWGRTTAGGTSSYTLQQVQLPIISYSNQNCYNAVHNDSIQFCAGFDEGGKDTCQGDSGGPLMTHDANSDTWMIAGITSYGYGCAQPEYPGVYTRVSMYMNWINAYTNGTGMHSGSKASASAKANMVVAIVLCMCFIFCK